MSAKSLSEVLNIVEDQLNWKGPNGKVMGHVVLSRDKAEELFKELTGLLEVVEIMTIKSKLAPGVGDAKK